MTEIDLATEALYGQPSWLARHGYGSFLTFEFGVPEFQLGKDRLGGTKIAGAPKKVWQRFHSIHGQWHLAIHFCFWSIGVKESELAHNESDDRTIARAMHVLNGQAITRLVIEPTDGSTVFSFDLGATLTTTPAPPGIYKEQHQDQWILFRPDGDVLTVRSDGMYSLGPGETLPGEKHWRSLPALDT